MRFSCIPSRRFMGGTSMILWVIALLWIFDREYAGLPSGSIYPAFRLMDAPRGCATACRLRFPHLLDRLCARTAVLQMLAFPLSMSPAMTWRDNDLMQRIMSVLSPVMIIPRSPDTSNVGPMQPSYTWNLYLCAVAFLLVMWGLFGSAVYAHLPSGIDASGLAGAQKLLQAKAAVNAVMPMHHVPGASSSSSSPWSDWRDDGSSSSYSGGSVSSNAAPPIPNSDPDQHDTRLRIPRWHLRLLRFMTSIGLHALFVPITTTLFTPLECLPGTRWTYAGDGDPSAVCFTGPHIGFFAASLVLLPLWLVWSVVMATCLIDPIPDLQRKKNFLCASHGRVFGAIVICKAACCGLVVFNGFVFKWAYTVAPLVFALFYCAAYWKYLPYFDQRLNQFQMVIGCILLQAAVSLVLANAVEESDRDVGPLSLLLLMIPMIYVGHSLAAVRFRTFGSHSKNLTSPYDVELSVRYHLNDLVDAVGSGQEVMAAVVRKQRATSLYANDVSGRLGAPTTTTSAMDEVDQQYPTQLRAVMNVTSAEADRLLARTLDIISHLFAAGLESFSSSAMLQLFYARHLGVYERNSHLERIALNEAIVRMDPIRFDIRYFVHRRRFEILKAAKLDTRSSVMTVERRMLFENLQHQVNNQVANASSLLLSFWTELAQAHPDLQTAQLIGSAIHASVQKTQQTFGRLLELSPQSSAVMRQYADFLLEVTNDSTVAEELLSEADRIEFERSKNRSYVAAPPKVDTEEAGMRAFVVSDVAFGALVPDFDLTSESLGWIKVSAHPSRLGTIVDININALKMWGYSQRRELVGRDMSFLLPEPIASVHPRFLQRFQATGFERVANQSRNLLAAHRNGYLVLVTMNIRPMNDEQLFVAVCEEVRTPINFILFGGQDDGWKITSASQSACHVLGTLPSQLKASNLSMALFAPDADPAAMLRTLKASSSPVRMVLGDTIICARLQVAPIPFLKSYVNILRFSIIGRSSGRTAAGTSQPVVSTVDGTEAGESHQQQLGPSHRSLRRSFVQGVNDYEAGAADADAIAVTEFTGVHSPNSTSSHADGDDASTVDSRVVAPSITAVVTARPDRPLRLRPLAVNERPVPSLVPIGPHASAAPATRSHFHSTLKQLQHEPSVDLVSMCPVIRTSITGNSNNAAHPHDMQHAEPSETGTTLLQTDAHLRHLQQFGNVDAVKSTSALTEDVAAQSGTPDAADDVADEADAVITSMSAASVPGQVQQLHSEADHGSNSATFEPQPVSTTASTATSRASTGAQAAKVTTTAASQPALYRASGAEVSTDGPTAASDGHEHNAAVAVMPKLAVPSQSSDVDATEAPAGHGGIELSQRRAAVNAAEADVHDQALTRRAHTSSESGTSSVSTIGRRLRANGDKMEGSLVLLRRAIKSVFAAVAVLDLISLVVTLVLFEQMWHNIDLVIMDGDRSVYASRSCGHLQNLVFQSDNKFHSLEGPQYSLDKLQTYVGFVEDLHRSLYMSLDGKLPAEDNLYMSSTAVSVIELVPGTYQSITQYNFTTRTLGLESAGLELISKLRMSAALGLSNVSMKEEPVWYVSENGLSGDISKAMNTSLMLADQRSASHVKDVQIANTAVIVVAECLILCMVVLVMIPAVNTAIFSKRSIYDVFVRVPLPIIRSLRDSTQKRLQRDSGDSYLDMGHSIIEPASARAAGGDGGSHVSSEHGSGYLNSPAGQGRALPRGNSGMNKIALASGSQTATAGRSYRNTSTARLSVLARMVWPLALCMFYFGMVFWYRYGVASTAAWVKSEILWSKQAQVRILYAFVEWCHRARC